MRTATVISIALGLLTTGILACSIPCALVARVRAMLRRTHGEIKTPAVIRVGSLEINSEKYSVTYDSVPVHLTPNKFKLLQLISPARLITVPATGSSTSQK